MENTEHWWWIKILLKRSDPTKISYYSSGLFEEICFQCGKVPEGENDESNRVNVNEGYYNIIIVMSVM